MGTPDVLRGAGLESRVHPAMSHCSSDIAEAVQVDGDRGNKAYTEAGVDGSTSCFD